MTCAEFNRYIDETSSANSAALPAEARAHLDVCPGCRELWNFLREEGTAAEIPPGVAAKIEKLCTGSLKPVQPIAGRRRLAAEFLTIFAVFTVIAVWYAGLSGTAGLNFLQLFIVLGFVGKAAIALAIVLSGEMVPGEKRFLNTPTMILLAIGVPLLLVAAFFPWATEGGFLLQNWKCFRFGALFSLPGVVTFGWLLRRGTLHSPGWAGAGAGALAGLVGAVGLHLGCPMHDAPHIAISHFGVPVVGGVLGFMAGQLFQYFWSGERSPSRVTTGS
jgi:hypothetical protein